MWINDRVKIGIGNYLGSKSSGELYRNGIYWSVIILATLVLGLTSYHIQAIPEKIHADVNRVLNKRPWVQDLVVVDGQHVFLRGEAEPDSGLETEIAAISQVPGVMTVTNVLDEIPRPSVHLRLQKSPGQFVVSGQLGGEYLEPVISYLEASFPDQRLKDQIKIDDRLGRPLWIEGFNQSLSQLQPLDEFELNGWRDQIEITGTTQNDLVRRQVGYAIPASLIDQVTVVNRLKQKVTDRFPAIVLLSDWRGSQITGVVPSAETREALTGAAKLAFGLEQIDSALRIDENLLGSIQLFKLSELLPSLNHVRDLRLESTEKGYVVWGRVDDAYILGQFLHARNELGLEQIVHNEITIAAPEKSASLTLFSDQQNAILNGVLPTMKSKQRLFGDIKEKLGVHSIVDLVSIEPNVAHSNWLNNWAALLADIPKSVIGITIDDNSLLVTGIAENAEQLAQFDQRLSILFPEMSRLNWVTAANQ